MSPSRLAVVFASVGLVLGAGIASAFHARTGDEPRAFTPSGFSFDVEVLVPGKPDEVFDAFTGDVTPWWDHTVSKKPKAMYIEPKPGGGFFEIFDDRGNGVRHAVVTAAKRGEMLRLVGPLGLAGQGVELEQTLSFSPEGEGTRIKLAVHGFGRIGDGVPGVVQQVWTHFLAERFVPHFTATRGKR